MTKQEFNTRVRFLKAVITFERSVAYSKKDDTEEYNKATHTYTKTEKQLKDFVEQFPEYLI